MTQSVGPTPPEANEPFSDISDLTADGFRKTVHSPIKAGRHRHSLPTCALQINSIRERVHDSDCDCSRPLMNLAIHQRAECEAPDYQLPTSEGPNNSDAINRVYEVPAYVTRWSVHESSDTRAYLLCPKVVASTQGSTFKCGRRRKGRFLKSNVCPCCRPFVVSAGLPLL